MQCPECRRDTPSDRSTCAHCGSPLPRKALDRGPFTPPEDAEPEPAADRTGEPPAVRSDDATERSPEGARDGRAGTVRPAEEPPDDREGMVRPAEDLENNQNETARLPKSPPDPRDGTARAPGGPADGRDGTVRLPEDPAHNRDGTTRLPGGHADDRDGTVWLPGGPPGGGDEAARPPEESAENHGEAGRPPGGPPDDRDGTTRLPGGPPDSHQGTVWLPEGPTENHGWTAWPPGGPSDDRDGTAWLPATRPEASPVEPAVYRWGAPPTADDARRQRPFGRSRRRGWTAVLVSTGIVTAAALGVGVAFGIMRGSHAQQPRKVTPQASSGAQSPATTSAHDQALAVNELLQTGREAHDRLPPNLDTCDDLAAAVPAFQQLVRDREEELSRAQRLQIDGLPGGADLRQALIDSYRYSLEADRAYLAWAQDVDGQGCGGASAPYTSSHEDAIDANDKAGPAKRRAVARWNPIAQSQGLPTYRWQDL